MRTKSGGIIAFIRRMNILANDDALDLWMRQTVGRRGMFSGTCKMGPDSDPTAVVDQYCRVKGIQGLWWPMRR